MRRAKRLKTIKAVKGATPDEPSIDWAIVPGGLYHPRPPPGHFFPIIPSRSQ